MHITGPLAPILSLALVGAPCLAAAQARPVHFTVAVRATGHDTTSAVLTARIDRGWHMYSLTQPPGGPVPLAFDVRAPFRVAGRVTAPAPHIRFDREFGIAIEQYDDSATFVLPLSAPASTRAPLHVMVRYQACDDRVCLAPTTVDVATANPVNLAR